jgi:hypothetical protein
MKSSTSSQMEPVLLCLNLGKLFRLEEDTLAYALDATLFQKNKNRQKRSMDYFSISLSIVE